MSDKVKILFVDDEPQILVTLRALFRAKYEVLTANSGAEALEIIDHEKIHAIISDQRMPHMFGHQLLQEVKKRSPFTMRILLTGYSDMSAIINSINEGEIFRFVNKPWQTAEIRGIVDSAVEIAQNTMQSVTDITDDEIETPTQRETVGVLVLDNDAQTLDTINKLFRTERPVYVAKSVDQAIDLLSEKEIGVILTDVEINGEDTTDFVKLLKQQYPLITTIVQTSAVDASMAIRLINQGQVYRYLRKPVSEPSQYLSIKSGLQLYQTNMKKPELLQRHKVDMPAETRNSSLAQKLMGRLRSLRWFRFSVA